MSEYVDGFMDLLKHFPMPSLEMYEDEDELARKLYQLIKWKDYSLYEYLEMVIERTDEDDELNELAHLLKQIVFN